jgi:rhombotail lipoprotein
MRTKSLPSSFAALTLMACLGTVACAGAVHGPAAPAAESPEAATPPPLERSLFSRDATGSVSEDDLQRVLASRLEVTFPFRLGVVSLGDAFRAESEAPVVEQAIVASEVASGLKGSTRFTHVTDVSTDLPNPAGMEGLRTIAARYRTRYLLVCSVRSEDMSHLNNWAWLYPTVVGVFLAPGLTVSSQGLMQASLLDVPSGTVLFTVHEPYSSSSVSWLIGSDREHGEVDAAAMREASKLLARSILSQTEQLAAWVEAENRAKERVAAK